MCGQRGENEVIEKSLYIKHVKSMGGNVTMVVRYVRAVSSVLRYKIIYNERMFSMMKKKLYCYLDIQSAQASK